LGAGDEEDVEAFGSELLGVLFADTVRGSGVYCTCTFFAEFGELLEKRIR
jgi:hypothetical protein